MDAERRSRLGGQAPLDDATIARIIELHRTPTPSGGRYSVRDIERVLEAEGRRVSRGAINNAIRRTRAETLDAAVGEVREKIAGQADENAERITRLARILEDAVVTGRWPNHDDGRPGDELSGHVRVIAAKDAIEASKALLGIFGVKTDGGELTPEQITARVDGYYGIGGDGPDEDEDVSPAATNGANGNGHHTEH